MASLNLYGNGIGDDGCVALGAGLMHTPQLATLNLGGHQQSVLYNNGSICNNGIKEGGCVALAAVLMHTPQLATLHINNNGIGDGGCVALGAGYPCNLKLSTKTSSIYQM
jgi:hypothetical protein